MLMYSKLHFRRIIAAQSETDFAQFAAFSARNARLTQLTDQRK